MLWVSENKDGSTVKTSLKITCDTIGYEFCRETMCPNNEVGIVEMKNCPEDSGYQICFWGVVDIIKLFKNKYLVINKISYLIS